MGKDQIKARKGSISDLTFDDKNFNKHTQFGMTLLEKSLRKNGAGRSVVVDKNNRIIGGNGIVETAGNIGLENTIVVETTGDELVVVKRTDVDLDTLQGREMALADNATAAADLDWNMDLIREAEKNLGLDAGEWGLPEIDDTDMDQEAEEDNFNVSENIPEQPKSRLGDLFQLGEHRLICGDSTKQLFIDRLMDGRQADLIVTDPPYNVNYESADGKKIENDHMADDAFLEFLKAAFTTGNEVLKPGGAFYIWHADSEGYNFRKACREVGWQVRQTLIWNKNALVLGRQDYQWKHEPCLYGWKDGAGHYFINRRDLVTVQEDLQSLDIDSMSKAELKTVLQTIMGGGLPTTIIDENKPLRSAEHPTMKPLKLIGRQIRNSARPGETVLDLFGGSGSTMMAAEQLGRRCCMVEFDPKYVDVIVKRWEELTGKEAQYLGNITDNGPEAK